MNQVQTIKDMRRFAKLVAWPWADFKRLSWPDLLFVLAIHDVTLIGTRGGKATVIAPETCFEANRPDLAFGGTDVP